MVILVDLGFLLGGDLYGMVEWRFVCDGGAEIDSWVEICTGWLSGDFVRDGWVETCMSGQVVRSVYARSGCQVRLYVMVGWRRVCQVSIESGAPASSMHMSTATPKPVHACVHST